MMVYACRVSYPVKQLFSVAQTVYISAVKAKCKVMRRILLINIINLILTAYKIKMFFNLLVGVADRFLAHLVQDL